MKATAKDKQLAVRFDASDLKLLDALAEFERLPLTEIIRRSVRHYAHSVGIVETPKPPKSVAA